VALTYEARVLRVLQTIHDHPASDLSLDALADCASVSRFHWHRVFRAMTGETCAQAVRRIRLTLAATWLLSREEPVAVIARDCGYPHMPSFVRAFSQRFGVSPVVFRRTRPSIVCPPPTTRGCFTMFPVEIDQSQARRLGALPHTGAYEGIGPVFDQVSTLATEHGLWPSVRGMVGVHYDDPSAVAETELRSHAGVWVADNTPLPAPLEELLLPASACAVLHYKGPYEAIKVAYDYLYGDWLPRSGREPADNPPYELYLNSPHDTPSGELLTDIVLPLVA